MCSTALSGKQKINSKESIRLAGHTECWIIELEDDHSYIVVGHPNHKFIFIMSRNQTRLKKTHDEIIARCKAKGYEVAKLTFQLQKKV